jgi:hypothetical protein
MRRDAATTGREPDRELRDTDATAGLSRPPGWGRRDAFAAIALGLMAFALAFVSARTMPATLFEADELHSVWFEADIGQFVKDMTSASGHTDTSVLHPLLPLLTYVPTKVVREIAGLDPHAGVNVVVGMIAGLWFAVLFGVLRAMGCRRLDSVLLATLAGSSAAAMFWFGVPESAALGSLSLLFACGLAGTTLPVWWHVAANVFTLSTTVTNWMAAIASALARFRVQRVLAIALTALGVVVVMAVVQRRLLGRDLFLSSLEHAHHYVFDDDALGPGAILRSIVYHTMVMPDFDVVDRYQRSGWPILVTQAAAPGSASPWGVAAAVLWTGLLGIGAWGAARGRVRRPFVVALALTLIGQTVLHLAWGDETFLFSLHFLPLWIMVAACATLTPARRVALAMMAALVVCAGINNAGQFRRARATVERIVIANGGGAWPAPAPDFDTPAAAPAGAPGPPFHRP